MSPAARRYPGGGLAAIVLGVVLSTSVMLAWNVPGEYSPLHPSTASLLYHGLTGGLSVDLVFAITLVTSWLLLLAGVVLDRWVLADSIESPPPLGYVGLAALPLLVAPTDLLFLLYSPRGVALLTPWVAVAAYPGIVAGMYLAERYYRTESRDSLVRTLSIAVPGTVSPGVVSMMLIGTVLASGSAWLLGQSSTGSVWTGVGSVVASAGPSVRAVALVGIHVVGTSALVSAIANDIATRFAAHSSEGDVGPSGASVFWVVPFCLLTAFNR